MYRAYSTWMKWRSHGKVLLLTGRRLPAAHLQQMAGDPWEVHDDVADLWAAMIPIRRV